VLDVLTTPGRADELSASGVRAAAGASWDRTVDRLLGVYGDVLEGRDRQEDSAWTAASTAS
jgi:hypothetical protein